jgi:DNA-binding CsgD family transcriptional regulator
MFSVFKSNRFRFILDNYLCMLHPEYGVASPFEDRSQAELFMVLLLDFLKDLSLRRNEIIPNQKVFHRVSVLDILKLLPQTNCRKCGLSSCMAFAAMLSIQQTMPTNCPYMGSPMTEQAVYPVFDDTGRLRSTVTLEMNPHRGNREQFIMKTIKGMQTGGQIREDANESLPTPLTDRELDVLRMVAHGSTNMQISRNLQISPHTVKSHIIHIFNKLGVNDRTLAAVWAAHHALV